MNLIASLRKCRHVGIRFFASSSRGRQPAHYHRIGAKPLVYRSLGQHLDVAAENYGNTEAVVSYHEGKRYTFASLREEVEQLAAGFIRLGLTVGDRIGIWSPNYMHWYLTYFAAAKAGLTSVGINPAFQGPEVEYCLKKVKVKAVVAPEAFKTQRYFEILKSICPELETTAGAELQSKSFPHLKNVIIDSETNFHGAIRFKDVFDIGRNSEARKKVDLLRNVVNPDSPCNIQFTSGSTGQPKAAMLSHMSIVNNGIHIGCRNELTNHRICVQVPLFHAFGVAITISAAMSYGATLVLPAAGYSPVDSLKAIIDEKCTVIHGTPTMYVDLIRIQKEQNFPISTPEFAVVGGSTSSPQLIKDMKSVLKLKRVNSIFGLTETTAVTFQSMPGDHTDRVLTSVGHVTDHLEVKVVDKNGNTVSFGEPGELCVRGYSVMLEYFEDQEKTKESLNSDRWFKTGDQFILTEDGYGQIIGRLKELMIRGGENIYPKEVEDVLNSHPDIIESYVIGVPDERMGEELCVYMRLCDGVADLTSEDIKAFCKGKIAHFKIPRYVRVVESLPKTTSGKIQKFKLKQLFANEK